MLPKNYDKIHGWCTLEKATKIIEIVFANNPKLIVELGVFGGKSLLPFALAAKNNNNNAKVIGIDAWSKDASLEGTNDITNNNWWSNINYDDMYNYTKTLMIENNVNHMVELYKEKSINVIDKFEDESIDILHQDSNHSQEISVQEVILYSKKLKMNGHWIFDDTNWDTTQNAQLLLLSFGFKEIYTSPKNDWKIFKKVLNIVDLCGNKIDTELIEKPEQVLANKYILENDVVLELGARYGSVSCTINNKLNNKYNQVVVEPDNRVWDALELNKINNNCNFNIVKGFISNKKLDLINLTACYDGYGATFIENNDTQIPSYSLSEIVAKYNLNFNVLVADCEGFLEVFFDENPTFYDNLRLIIFEKDYTEKCDYDKIINNLIKKKFKKIIDGHQNVWMK